MMYLSVWKMTDNFMDGRSYMLNMAVDVYARDVVRMRISEEEAMDIIRKMKLIEQHPGGEIWILRD